MNREDCIRLLKEKAEQLEGRFPRRDDFAPHQSAAIKSFFGPWPRALEAAGVKPPRSDGYEERKLMRRIRTKRRKTQAKTEKRRNKHEENNCIDTVGDASCGTDGL